jgi:NADH:ubiquinone oxidoreductase subunit F (NADH-binding)
VRVVLPAQPVASLDQYLGAGGGQALELARTLAPDEIAAELTRAGLRGRGGAGFPTGTKWRSVITAPGRHRYAVANGAEGEPGTFKDRSILRADPYQVVEGLAIAAYALGAREVFVALKASFTVERERVLTAVTEMEQAGLLGDLSVGIVAGPEEYLFGEEKALLEVIEGNDPLPRWLPPYVHGLFATAPQLGWAGHDPEVGHAGAHESNPTLVNNVETLANVTHVLARGADWFRTMGTRESPGTIVCTVVGDVDRPGVVEVELGTPLRTVLTACGARDVKAVFPGVTNAVLTGADLDTPCSYEGFAAAGSGLGAAGFIVYDDTACMLDVARMFSRFLWVESCGQCPPCKLGTGEITASLDDVARGHGRDAAFESINHWLSVVADGNRCFLPVEEQQTVASILRAFPEDFAAHRNGSCPTPRHYDVPKVVDIGDQGVVYDVHQSRKRPDWTYEDRG